MRILPALFASVLLAACVPVTQDYWDKTERTPKPGEVVRIETTAGEKYQFRVVRIEERAFFGVHADGHEYRVPFKLVSKLWVRTTETEWEALDFNGVCCFVPR
jgi:hypothetical protein